MEKEKNIIMMVKLYLKENIQKEKDGIEKNIIIIEWCMKEFKMKNLLIQLLFCLKIIKINNFIKYELGNYY